MDVRFPVLSCGLLGFGAYGRGIDGEGERGGWFVELGEYTGFVRVVEVEESVVCLLVRILPS